MKKHLIVLILIVCNLFCFGFLCIKQNPVFAEQNKKYAQIVFDNVCFYSGDKTPLFILPQTFYCQILKQVDADGFYYCKYINQYGYVKKDEVQCVSSCPQKPFLDYVNFRVLASQSAELRSEPTRQNGLNSLICALPLYETNFILYGKMQGEEVVPQRGNDWFYCEYSSQNKTLFGFVYSGLCDQIKSFEPLPIDSNTISEHSWADGEDFADASEQSENLAFVMPDSNQMIIIICISVPLLLLLIVLFMPAKQGENNKKRAKNSFDDEKQKANTKVIQMPKMPKKIRKAEKGKDFYEFK